MNDNMLLACNSDRWMYAPMTQVDNFPSLM